MQNHVSSIHYKKLSNTEIVFTLTNIVLDKKDILNLTYIKLTISN